MDRLLQNAESGSVANRSVDSVVASSLHATSLMKHIENEISVDELQQVGGAGFVGPSPIVGRIGWHEEYRIRNNHYQRRELGPRGGVYPWRKVTPTWPND